MTGIKGSVVVNKRKELNLTQYEIAKEHGISRQHYNAVENFKKRPSVDLAKELAKNLGLEWTIFFD